MFPLPEGQKRDLVRVAIFLAVFLPSFFLILRYPPDLGEGHGVDRDQHHHRRALAQDQGFGQERVVHRPGLVVGDVGTADAGPEAAGTRSRLGSGGASGG